MQVPNSVVHAALDALASGGPDRQVGLSTTPITVAPDGLSGITEPVAASYERASLPASSWAAAADRAVQSDPALFPDAVQDWGVIVAYFLTDGAGVPELAFVVSDGGFFVAAGTSDVQVSPRLTSIL